MKPFTATEWRDLARGARALANQCAADRDRNKSTSMEAFFEAARKKQLDLAQRCEELAKRAPD